MGTTASVWSVSFTYTPPDQLGSRFSPAGLCSRLKSPKLAAVFPSTLSNLSSPSCRVLWRYFVKRRQHILLWSKCCYSSQKGIGYTIPPSLKFSTISVFPLPSLVVYCEYRISSLKIQRSWCGHSLRKQRDFSSPVASICHFFKSFAFLLNFSANDVKVNELLSRLACHRKIPDEYYWLRLSA